MAKLASGTISPQAMKQQKELLREANNKRQIGAFGHLEDLIQTILASVSPSSRGSLMESLAPVGVGGNNAVSSLQRSMDGRRRLMADSVRQQKMEEALFRQQLEDKSLETALRKRELMGGGMNASIEKSPMIQEYEDAAREQRKRQRDLEFAKSLMGEFSGSSGPFTERETTQQIVNNAGSWEPRNITTTRSGSGDQILALLKMFGGF